MLLHVQLLDSGKLEARQEHSKREHPEAQPRGTLQHKVKTIDDAARVKAIENRAIKEGSEQEKLLNETEQTLRFGLFCISFMYFRSIAMLKREQVLKACQNNARYHISALHSDSILIFLRRGVVVAVMERRT